MHFPCLASFEDVEIAGICAFNEQRLLETLERFSLDKRNAFLAKTRLGYRIMLDSIRPDEVYVVGPLDLVFEVW